MRSRIRERATPRARLSIAIAVPTPPMGQVGSIEWGQIPIRLHTIPRHRIEMRCVPAIRPLRQDPLIRRLLRDMTRHATLLLHPVFKDLEARLPGMKLHVRITQPLLCNSSNPQGQATRPLIIRPRPPHIAALLHLALNPDRAAAAVDVRPALQGPLGGK